MKARYAIVLMVPFVLAGLLYCARLTIKSNTLVQGNSTFYDTSIFRFLTVSGNQRNVDVIFEIQPAFTETTVLITIRKLLENPQFGTEPYGFGITRREAYRLVAQKLEKRAQKEQTAGQGASFDKTK
jgi:hypothetical protein